MEMEFFATTTLKNIEGSSRTGCTKAMENIGGKTGVSTMEAICPIRGVAMEPSRRTEKSGQEAGSTERNERGANSKTNRW